MIYGWCSDVLSYSTCNFEVRWYILWILLLSVRLFEIPKNGTDWNILTTVTLMSVSCMLLNCGFSLTARNFELKREDIKLLEVLGEGQFGDVFKGLFTDKVCGWIYMYQFHSMRKSISYSSCWCNVILYIIYES